MLNECLKIKMINCILWGSIIENINLDVVKVMKKDKLELYLNKILYFCIRIIKSREWIFEHK